MTDLEDTLMSTSQAQYQQQRSKRTQPTHEQQAQSLQRVTSMLIEQQDQFLAHAKSTGLDWESEQLFALQAMSANSFLASTALQNPASLRTAILNVAAIGMTLNPERKLAYLVPRDGGVVLDISAKGMRTVAEQEGSIVCASVELVYANDKFKWKGSFEEPDFDADVFATPEERGSFRGAFCTAILPNGQKMVEPMSATEIYKIRDFSKAYTKDNGNNKSPWNTFFEEMVKKTVLKRSYKSWPRPDASSNSRLENAIRVLNEHEGLREEYTSTGMQENVVKLPDASSHSKSKSNFIYDESCVSQDVRDKVEIIVNRATNANAWAAAKELVRERYKFHDQHFALLALDEAQKNPHLIQGASHASN